MNCAFCRQGEEAEAQQDGPSPGGTPPKAPAQATHRQFPLGEDCMPVAQAWLG